MHRFILLILLFIFLSPGVTARESTDSVSAVEDGGPLTVSLLTCAPGPDVYELCGHTAIRIRNAEMDSVWNYGIFDFDAPNFIYRFCKGQTDYMVMGCPIEYFMPPYLYRGSKVTEQVLNMTQEEARSLRTLLQTEALPQNRTYRYNYVKDNCATRPWQRIRQAIAFGDRNGADDSRQPADLLSDTLYFSTFRAEMKHFHKNYPWYQFGIDLALGSGIDRPLERGQDIFAPPVLAAKLSAATRTIPGDGGLQEADSIVPLVVRTDVLYPGVEDATLPPTPWYLTPSFVGLMMLIISLAVMLTVCIKTPDRSHFSGRRKRIFARLWISIYFIAAGVAGFVITFLVFFSEHEATSPNAILLWLNPLQLIIGLGIWFRSWRKIVYPIAVYDFLLALYIFSVRITSMFVPAVYYIHFAAQVSNTAILLMSVCMLPLAVAVITIIKPVCKNPAPWDSSKADHNTKDQD